MYPVEEQIYFEAGEEKSAKCFALVLQPSIILHNLLPLTISYMLEVTSLALILVLLMVTMVVVVVVMMVAAMINGDDGGGISDNGGDGGSNGGGSDDGSND